MSAPAACMRGGAAVTAMEGNDISRPAAMAVAVVAASAAPAPRCRARDTPTPGAALQGPHQGLPRTEEVHPHRGELRPRLGQGQGLRAHLGPCLGHPRRGGNGRRAP